MAECAYGDHLDGRDLVGLHRKRIGPRDRGVAANRAEILKIAADAVAARVRVPKKTEPERVLKPEPQPDSKPQAMFLTTAQLAERWYYHPESVRRLVRSGVLSSVRMGRQVRIPLQEVERYEREATLTRRR
jgi:excisionase family DNA binding protein